ncbi:aminotransferase class V-fold PLP-dependent enzyme [Paractinoplanes brasiliensis]|uniref:Cysteine desulfurase/selenocysteine lyase n=1 Tax=Paractinoplanes brasiliensis TaxID=52695 RepID=A0A4R6JYH8_9ACTN|nr:aminotransferase class V-fold PLP-dependent enzyme [Actinoplanes brasiliensis]TDO41923.1 cysteine desulfurase/selenocysteine lyase [Actinoplanes brasiliensis]GID29795.1 putative cysteine desulfurase [Actinoplanes brasiliensis]
MSVQTVVARYNHGAAFPDELRSWQAALRRQFPIIVANPGLAYLDSAATAQKPQPVLDAAWAYLNSENANASRGSYTWGNRTTERIERARMRVRAFLDDPDPSRSGVHFVSGATEGLRTVARDWLTGYLRDGDEIIIPYADHSANMLPWLEAVQLLDRQGIRVIVHEMPYDSAQEYDVARLARLVTDRTRFIATTQVHHVYGGDMNVHRLRRVAGPGVVICVDAAQSAGHLPISVRDLDADFVVFSGHKAMALPGTGVVWAANRQGPVFTPGGWAGTPNTSGIVSLAAALDWLDAAGTTRIARWTVALGARLTDGLRRLPSYEVLGCQDSLPAASAVQQRHGIITFRHHRIGSNDLGFVLADAGFLVRADDHCQGERGERTTSVRVSLHVYNTAEEIDRLLSLLAELDTQA